MNTMMITKQTMSLARQVLQALLDEVTLTPKPGLVDLRSRGAHADLNWALMCHSACALQPVFQAMADAGAEGMADDALRQRIGAIGREGEAVMMAATGGVNTHRGAIWALGLLVTAAAQLQERGDSLVPTAVAARAGALARLARPATRASWPAASITSAARAARRWPVFRTFSMSVCRRCMLRVRVATTTPRRA